MKKTSKIQNMIYEFLTTGEKDFDQIFAHVKDEMHAKWLSQATEFGVEYEKLLQRKRGEIYSLLISDGNIVVSNLDGIFRWSNKVGVIYE